MSDDANLKAQSPGNLSYTAYYKRKIPLEDPEITHTDPGTPLGEYMRRYWQPVCMSEQLGDVPHKIRIMGEDLVAFRDKQGNIGVFQRHCAHRGASLEYGIIGERGLRCPYHAFHYDIDGTLLDTPAEPDRGARLSKSICQGAYPAFERDGLVFAYMGPPEKQPPFPEWDAFDKYADTRLVPFSNVYPCNWLQVLDNIADQLHTSTLHNPAILFDGTPPADIDIPGFTLPAFRGVPVLDFVEVRRSTSMAFVAGRRMNDELVWWRINECVVPNNTFHAYLFEDGSEPRKFHRVHMARWYVPVDDTNSIIYGWRMFGGEIDPKGAGREERVGWDDIDFLEGQVNNRSYEEQVRLPGDWEVIVGQRPIAVHALENPTSADAGVYMFRKILRQGVQGKNPGASPESMHERAASGLPTHCYTQNNTLRVPRRANDEEDRKLIKEVGRRIISITEDADVYQGEERVRYVKDRLEALEREYE
ncbi:MAG: ring-hydroxylating oxygenase subunit alpha [Proteobacteria bacterium]|nr:MAG: ring-hydroxylating oxygenase subunit alpha [Pseudomonadota bacterium]